MLRERQQNQSVSYNTSNMKTTTRNETAFGECILPPRLDEYSHLLCGNMASSRENIVSVNENQRGTLMIAKHFTTLVCKQTSPRKTDH